MRPSNTKTVYDFEILHGAVEVSTLMVSMVQECRSYVFVK